MFSNNSTPFTMPVTPAYGNGGFGGFGDNGAWWIIILIVLFGWGGNGYGRGFGCGQVSDNYVLTSDMSQLSRQIADTTAMTERKLDSVNNGLCDGFYTNAQLINGVNANILTTGNGIQNAITQDTIANMQNTNALATQLADCCCRTQQNIKDTQYVISDKANMLDRGIADGLCQTNFNAERNTRSIVDSQNAGTQAILAKLNDMETSRLREKLEAERDAKYALQGQLDRAQLRTDIVNDVRPCPKPAYITCNPFGCNCQNGYNYGYGTTIA